MPIFIDTHEGMTELPPDLRRMVEQRIRTGEKDDFGVIDRGLVLDHEGGRLHCILEGPDREAITNHHRALNAPVPDAAIHRAEIILPRA